jgi:hypothetical protein
MALSEAFQDSATVSTTEYFLASDGTVATYQSDDGVYQLFLDLSTLAAGDIFQVRCYERISSGGTSRVVWIDNVAGPLDSPMYATPTLILLHGWEFSLTKIAGTDRSIAWSIRRVA